MLASTDATPAASSAHGSVTGQPFGWNLIIRLIIQTIRQGRSRSGGIDEAPNRAGQIRLEPTRSTQITRLRSWRSVDLSRCANLVDPAGLGLGLTFPWDGWSGLSVAA
jgi:hypothetical protein